VARAAVEGSAAVETADQGRTEAEVGLATWDRAAGLDAWAAEEVAWVAAAAALEDLGAGSAVVVEGKRRRRPLHTGRRRLRCTNGILRCETHNSCGTL